MTEVATRPPTPTDTLSVTCGATSPKVRGTAGAEPPTYGVVFLRTQRQLYSPTASDMHFVRDMSFGRGMRYARWKKEANRISLRPAGAISLLRSKNITPSRARHITSQQLPPYDTGRRGAGLACGLGDLGV